MKRNLFFNLMLGIIFLLIVFSFSGCKKEEPAIKEALERVSTSEVSASNKIYVKITEKESSNSIVVSNEKINKDFNERSILFETFHTDSKKNIDQLLLPQESCFKQVSNHLIISQGTFEGRIIVCVSPKIGKTKVIIFNGYSGKISEITSDLDTKDPELLKNFFNKGASLPQIIARDEIIVKIKEPNKNIIVYKFNKDTQEFEIDKNISLGYAND